MRSTLTIIYLAISLWFCGAYPAKAGRMFAPLGLCIVALLTAALAVDPFLYAALLIELAALLCVPLLTPPGKPFSRGVVRFITFQSLGTPLFLLTGWMLAGLESTPGDQQMILRAAVLLGLGFSFWLAIFPFHSWLPMLAGDTHPYPAAFVFFTLPSIIALFGLTFLERYAWMRLSPGLIPLLMAAGAVMIITGGVWAAFQTQLGRILGFAVMVDIGLILLSIGAGLIPGPNQVTASRSNPLFNALFLSNGLALGTWALGLSILRQRCPDLQYRQVQGMGRQFPIASGSLILAQFSMAGFPLLAGFPVRLALLEQLSSAYTWVAILVVLGCLGLLISALRSLAVLIMGPEKQVWMISETRLHRVILFLAVAALIIAGLFPRL